MAVRLVGDIPNLENGRGGSQPLGDLHLTCKIPLSIGVAQIAQLVRQCIEGIVHLPLLRHVRGGGVQPCLFCCECDMGTGRCILYDEVTAEDAAVCAASVEDALIAAVVVNGDRLVLTLEDVAARRCRGAADEMPNLAALIEIAVLVRTLLLSCSAGRKEPAVLPRSAVREVEINTGVHWIRAVLCELV